jgi:hypothetical protein
MSIRLRAVLASTVVLEHDRIKFADGESLSLSRIYLECMDLRNWLQHGKLGRCEGDSLRMIINLLYVGSLRKKLEQVCRPSHAQGRRAGIVMRLWHSHAAVREYALQPSCHCTGDSLFLWSRLMRTCAPPFPDELGDDACNSRFLVVLPSSSFRIIQCAY